MAGPKEPLLDVDNDRFITLRTPLPRHLPNLYCRQTRDALLKAIARSRGWVDAILSGHTTSIEEIATAEGLAERHVRFLMPLAFASPRIVAAIAEGDVPRDLTVSDSRER